MNRQQKITDKHPATVVVVNDDPTQLNVLAGLMRKEGINATAFESAETALSGMAPEHPPDLIITDLYMPGIDGWRFCRLLRSPEYKAFNAVPILVISATLAGDEASRITADLGANAFLPSPVIGQQFVDTVRSLLAGEQAKWESRVLIVEDSRTLAGLLTKQFTKNGFRADTACSVREASVRFAEAAYDIAVLDYHLPDGLGDALLQDFRTKNPGCVCVMITTDPNPKLALSWMKAGAAGYLHKPFDPEYLIEQCIRARRERALMRVEDLLEKRTRELRESEKNFRLLFDSIGDILVVASPAGRILFSNLTTKETLGYSDHELAKMHLLEWHRPEDRNEAEKIFTAMIKGERHTCPLPLSKKDGSLVPVETRVWCGKWNGVDCIYGISKNLSAEQEAQQRFERIFYNNPSPMALTNVPDRRFFDINDAFVKAIGYERREVIGKTAAELSLFANPEEQTLVTNTLRHKGCISSIELQVRRKDGTLLNGLFWSDSVSSQGRRFFLTLMLDITEQKRLEAERRTLENRIHQMEKTESLTLMTGAIAHLFNNHLAAVIGNLELLAEDLLPDANVSESLREAQTAAHRAAETSGLMLTFLGQSQRKPVLVDLADVCRRCLARLKADIPTAVEIICGLPDTGLVIRIDKCHLDQIISALFTNALESLEKAGKVRVSIHTASAFDIPDTHRFPLDWKPISDSYACLTIADTGCGMDEKTIDRIFDPFYTQKFTGRGLGLAVVLGIVKMSEGCITVESAPSKGSVFQVFWPISPEADPSTRIEQAC